MNYTYNDNTERPKPKENQLGILGISSREFTHSVTEIQQRPSGPRESAAGAMYLSLRIPPKVAATLLWERHSWSIVVT